ncbi:hypothetical protein BT69DRAFT_14660 [Atractiella rhizophila]|nr:hypothetical protein BT69DRAFT_14660 [Atractiella rhizophila]
MAPSAQSHIQVSILPSSSSFFAGELLSFTLTFRNTCPPPPPPTSSFYPTSHPLGNAAGGRHGRVQSLAIPSSGVVSGLSAEGMKKALSLRSIEEDEVSIDVPPTAGLEGWQVPTTPQAVGGRDGRMAGMERKGLVGKPRERKRSIYEERRIPGKEHRRNRTIV